MRTKNPADVDLFLSRKFSLWRLFWHLKVIKGLSLVVCFGPCHPKKKKTLASSFVRVLIFYLEKYYIVLTGKYCRIDEFNWFLKLLSRVYLLLTVPVSLQTTLL